MSLRPGDTECSLTRCSSNIPPLAHSAGEKVETQKTKTTLGSPGGRAQGRRKGKEVGNGGSHQVTPGFGPSLAQQAEPPGRAKSRPQECRRAHLGAGGRGSRPAAAARLRDSPSGTSWEARLCLGFA